MASYAESLAEAGWVPDYILRKGIRYRCAQILQEFRKGDVTLEHSQKLDFVRKLKQQPIAINTKDANEQHYEVKITLYI
jgi:cyclopropane-fatty-acyl-phospholipid synthase